MFGENQTLHSNIRTSSQPWSTVVGVSWFEAALLLAIIDGTMNSGLNQQILHENVRASVQELKLNRKWVMQQGNDHKHYNRMAKAEEILHFGTAKSKYRPQTIWNVVAEPEASSSRMKAHKYLSWSNSVTRNRPKFLQANLQDWSRVTGNIWWKLLLLEGVPPVTECKGSHPFSDK